VPWLLQKAIWRCSSIKEAGDQRRALREGMIVDWMLRHGLIVGCASAFQAAAVDQRTVEDPRPRFPRRPAKGPAGTRHALHLYEQLAKACSIPRPGRKAVNCSGRTRWLHTCGQHINISAYHKAQLVYLIRHAILWATPRQVKGGKPRPLPPPQLPKKRHEAGCSWASSEATPWTSGRWRPLLLP